MTMENLIYADTSPNTIYDETSNLEETLKRVHDTLEIESVIHLKVAFNTTLYLGYIISLGYKILEVHNTDNVVTLRIKKTKKVQFNPVKKPSILIKLPRTGKNGKRIFVYKLRTMEPYSEFMQDFVIEQNGLNQDGTIRNDFRITKVGKFLRRYWLDELPMLINFIKGDLKLIGFRPLSDTMLNTYPQEFVLERNKYKPGLIPPYYIDRPNSFEGLIESEKNYIKKYRQQSFKTDITYFYRFLNAIFIRGSRSS